MSIYSELTVDELWARYCCCTLPITDKELIELLFDKHENGDTEIIYLLEEVEGHLEEAEKENRRLIQDVKELEQKLEDIRRIL